MEGFSDGDGSGLEEGLFLRGEAVRDATLARTAVALPDLGFCACSGEVVYECCLLICGCVMVAAVSGERFIDEAAMVLVEFFRIQVIAMSAA